MSGSTKLGTFDLVMLVLTIVALGIAAVHLISLHDTANRMTAIQDGLSTQYLGGYPAFFPKIVRVVNSAQRNLVIVCDFPAYGSFSEPSTAEDYFHAIRKRRQFANLDVTFLKPIAQDQLLNTLFGVDKWSNWQDDNEKRAKVLQFLKLHGRSPDAVKTRNDLLQVLRQVNDEAVRDVFLNRANQKPIDIPIYFWIADCHDAVFTIASPGDGVEQGFYTSDKSLIRSLLDVRKRYGNLPASTSPLNRCDQ